VEIPSGDHLPRYVCSDCEIVHYENPRPVIGCVPEYHGKILLCRRAIEPRKGYWTVPAGFMELGESMEQAAARETHEEACAEVALGPLLAVVDVVHAGQVHVFYRATLTTGQFAPGEESLETQLFSPADIPWDEIAFPSGVIALRHFLNTAKNGDLGVKQAVAQRIPPL
jgi:ADP-ribose pyrophosphatase YjhB (NUDIX family)